MTTSEKKRSQSESLATTAKAFGCVIFDTGYQSAVIDTAKWLKEHAKIYGIDTANLKALLCNYKQDFDPE